MRRALVPLLLAIAATGLAAPAVAAPGVEIERPERADGRLTFDITTPGGPLLTSDDVSVSINGVEADDVVATARSSYESPAGVTLVIDASGSMAGAPIEDAKAAIASFVAEVGGNTQIALIHFSSEVRLASSFTENRDRIVSAVEALEASGETALYDAVIRATDLARGRPLEQRNVVLLTDGADTVSDATLGDALAAAQSSEARIFAVALKSEDFSARSIDRFTTATNGRLLETSDSAQLSRLFKDLARTLVTGYTISVRDPNPSATTVDIAVAVAQPKGVAKGSASFSFPATTDDGDEPLPIPQVPLPLLLFTVFVGCAGLAFLALEWVRRRRTSVAQQLVWYTEDGREEVDSEALINAAVLRRAQELATDFAQRTGRLYKIEREVDAAAMRWRTGEILVASSLLAVAGAAVGLALGGILFALLLGAAAGGALWIVVRFKAAARRRRFETQLPDVLLLMGGALKAGYSLQQAIGAVGEDAKPPAGEEFRRAMAEIRLGASVDDALGALAARLAIVDFEWTVLAIQIQREVGGNLADILQTISETIRERERIRRQIKTFTAEARLSAIVLGALPFGMAGFLLVTNPAYLEPLFTTPMGRAMLLGAGLWMLVGFFWMKKIVNIEV